MDIKRAKEEIKDSIEAYLLKDAYGEYEIPVMRQRPIFLLGAPGIGKTQIMEQVARECGIGLVAYTITHHTRQSAIGLPLISKNEYGGKAYSVTEYTMSEIIASVYKKIEETGLSEGILFIDEINCVSETLAPAMLQFLQYKTFGNHEVPKGWVIVAAGNPPEYNKSVREFDVVTMDRVKKIEVEADFSVWKEYAYHQGIHPAVISYLTNRQNYFYKMEHTVDGSFFATPRGWEDLSRLIQVYEKLGKKVDRDVVGSYIQFPEIAKDFANYLELYYRYEADYQVEQVMEGKIPEILLKKISHASFDEKLSVISLLLARVTEVFRKVFGQEAYVSMLFEKLKQYKDVLGQKKEAVEAFREILEETCEEQKEKERAKLLTKTEKIVYRKGIEKLELYLKVLEEEQISDGENAFEKIRGLFAEERGAYEKLEESAGQKLEYAFDFMEIAFGASQEMTIFITELNMNAYSVKFLQEYQCDRYYQYNKQLVFDETDRNIRNRIERVEMQL